MSETRLTSIFDRPAADPAPDLHVAAAETRCERVDRVFAKIGRDRITRMGLVGNERFAAMME